MALALVPGVAEAAPGPPDGQEWWFDSWSVPALWAGGADGRGIVVSVIDTGVQGDIPELNGKVLPGADLIGNGSHGTVDYDRDAFSHGTAMASIIAAGQGYLGIEGLAPAARILPIAVPLRGVARKGIPTQGAPAVAIDYAVDHGARIINLSLGGISLESQQSEACEPALQVAVTRALAKGALVVAAGGNSGDKGSPVEEPGVCLGVVSVGAVDQALNVTSFSSRQAYLTVTAPGDHVPSLSRKADSAYIGEGTSQATAITSAALALIWSRYPSETNRQILTRLLSTATDRGTPGRDSAYGLGVIDPQAAIAAGVPAAAAPNVVFDGIAPLAALNAATAKAAAPRTVAVAGNARAPLGAATVGTAPALLGAGFWVLGAAALLCAVLAVSLLVLAVRRARGRRRRPPVI